MPIAKPEDPCKRCGGIEYEMAFEKNGEAVSFVCVQCNRKEIYRLGASEPEIIDPPEKGEA